MSSVSVKIYAKALADSLSAKRTDEKKIAKNFLQLVQKNGDMKKIHKILALAQEFLLKHTGNKKIVLETARKTDTSHIIKTFAKKGDIVEEKINPAMIAGVKITVDNHKQLDFSLIKKLENIF
ncbi:F0F1 ATP synthase subunit delta [Candidatus Parcubacteria bacterium]|nr:F0F1 ATP synthase subunit delta [Candidatus Parcubacteria bacterium]